MANTCCDQVSRAFGRCWTPIVECFKKCLEAICRVVDIIVGVFFHFVGLFAPRAASKRAAYVPCVLRCACIIRPTPPKIGEVETKWITPEQQLKQFYAPVASCVSAATGLNLDVANLVAEYIEVDPALKRWYEVIAKLQIFPQKIPPLPMNIGEILESRCPCTDQLKPDGTFYKVKETHAFTLNLQEWNALTLSSLVRILNKKIEVRGLPMHALTFAKTHWALLYKIPTHSYKIMPLGYVAATSSELIVAHINDPENLCLPTGMTVGQHQTFLDSLRMFGYHDHYGRIGIIFFSDEICIHKNHSEYINWVRRF